MLLGELPVCQLASQSVIQPASQPELTRRKVQETQIKYETTERTAVSNECHSQPVTINDDDEIVHMYERTDGHTERQTV